MPLQLLKPSYEAKRLPELLGALVIKRRQERRDSWTRSQIEALQRRRLTDAVAHAAERSPFYRDLYKSISSPETIALDRLPIVTRQQLMDRFDDWVTDPRLKLSALEGHVAEFEGPDGYYMRRYRVLTTSGSSGSRAIFAFDRQEWRVLQAQLLRFMDSIGVGWKPSLKPRMKNASVFAERPLHITYRLAVSCDTGATRILRKPATTPIQEIVRALNEFQPDWLHAYASIASLLAEEQLQGRLRISPRAVSTVGEVRTPQMAERMTAAWGSRVFDKYWMTEGGIAMECEHHRLHATDDEVLMEVVDEDNRPVGPERGHKILVTNLYMRTQPLIRCEVPDLVIPSGQPCPCGRPYPVLSSVDGRSDDVLHLPDGKGGRVPVHPTAFRSPLTTESEVRLYQVVERPGDVLVKLVPALEADRDALRERVQARLQTEVAKAGAAGVRVTVELVDEIARDPQRMDKLKLVESEVDREPRDLAGAT